MGLKMSIVVIEGKPKCTVPELVESLGFRNISFLEDAPFSQYINPAPGYIAVAFWKDFTVIAHDHLPMSMINLDFADKQYFNEATLRRYFETKNNMAVLLHSVSNTYGMSKRSGNSFSMVYGHCGGLHISRGEKTEIEKKYLENSYTDPDGETLFRIDGRDFTRDQIGENIVLWNLEDFTGMPSGELFDLQARAFTGTDEHLIYHS